jgi:membrane-associated phospholipid phosphatase
MRRLDGMAFPAHPRKSLTDAADNVWYRQLWPRFCRLFWLKCSGTTIIMFLFFAGYFQVLRHPAYPLTTMPATVLDALVPFYPPALLAYASLWFYVPLAPALLLGLRELLTYGIGIVGLCIGGLLIFYYWPTTMPPHGIDRTQFWGFDILHGVDAAANACPSLHVATAAFSFYWFDRVLREMHVGAPGRALNVLWFAAIAYSTMATKQHVFVDVVAGFAFGTAFALSSLWCRSAVSWQRYQRERAIS